MTIEWFNSVDPLAVSRTALMTRGCARTYQTRDGDTWPLACSTRPPSCCVDTLTNHYPKPRVRLRTIRGLLSTLGLRTVETLFAVGSDAIAARRPDDRRRVGQRRSLF